MFWERLLLITSQYHNNVGSCWSAIHKTENAQIDAIVAPRFPRFFWPTSASLHFSENFFSNSLRFLYIFPYPIQLGNWGCLSPLHKRQFYNASQLDWKGFDQTTPIFCTMAPEDYHPILQGFLGTLFTWAMTAAGTSDRLSHRIGSEEVLIAKTLFR